MMLKYIIKIVIHTKSHFDIGVEVRFIGKYF